MGAGFLAMTTPNHTVMGLPRSTRSKSNVETVVEEFRRLAADGKAVKDIAVKLGIDWEQAVYLKRKHGIKTSGHQTRDMDKARQIDRYSRTHGCAKAAKRYGLSVYAVKAIRQRCAHYARSVRASYSDEYLVSLRSQAILYANNRRYFEVAPDFASYVIEKALSGKKQEFKFAWVQFLREYYGDIRNPDGEARSNGLRNYSEIVEYRVPGDDHGQHRTQAGAEDPTRANAAIIELANDLGLKGETRAMFILQHHYGFKNHEIATLWGLTGSRISQLSTATTELVQKKVNGMEDYR
jgi:hypothetical protein